MLYGLEHELTDRAKLDAIAFSPAFLYQMLKSPDDVDCQAGSNPVLGFDALKSLGIPRAVTMPYACNVAPNAAALLEAVDHQMKALGHGVLTYVLLDALDGKADSGDGRVSVNELKAYVEALVPEVSQAHKGSVQLPASYGFGQDFPLATLKAK